MDPLIENLKKQRKKTTKESARASTRRNPSSDSPEVKPRETPSTFLKLALTTGVVLSLAVIFFVFNTFGETKINVTINSNPDLNSGLMVHWTFDGPDMDLSSSTAEVLDSSGQGNNGDWINYTTPSTYVGKIGQAMDFDGSNDYVHADPVDQTGSFTISMWVKAGVLGQAQYESMFASQSGGATADSFQIDTTGADVYRILFSDSSGSQQGVNFGTLTLNWQHLTATWDGTKADTYLDGVFQATKTFTYTGIIQEYNVGRNRGSNRYSQGQIDDFRIYNRALSADEITRLYQLGATTKINKTLTTNPDLNDGLVGHWTFDGADMTSNVADSSGNGNTGYLTGFTSTTTTVGKIGQGLSFDGVDDTVDVANSSSLQPTSFTLSVWAKSDTATWDTVSSFISKRSAFQIFENPGGTKVYVQMWDSDGLVNGTINNWGVVSYSVSDITVWHHYVGVYDSLTGFIGLYVDGDLKSSIIAAGNLGLNLDTGPLRLGQDDGYSTGRFFKGSLDDARVYNRALSADEISRLYQQGATTYINKTIATSPDLNDGLVGHWTFDGPDMNNGVEDSSGNGNTGYLTGFTSTTTAPGKIGQALEFDFEGTGGNRYIDLGSASSLDDIDTQGGGGISGSMWLNHKRPTSAGANQAWFISKDIFPSTSSGGWQFNFSNQALSLRFRKSFSTTVLNVITANGAISNNEWYHIAFTWDGSSNASGVHIYVDGTEVSSYQTQIDGVGTKNSDASNTLYIGSAAAGPKDLQGTVDDVRLYNKVLTPDEIKRLYQLGR